MRRLSFAARTSLLVGTAAGLPTLFACLDHPLKGVEYDARSEGSNAIQLTVNKDVDILFLIDNSGSMGDEQGLLAKNFPAFINVLEEKGVEANYRIGVTTTDNGNPACRGTGPEGGTLQPLTSCRQRTGEFVFNGTPMVDATQVACLDQCDLEDLDIQPTTTALDSTPKVRPWLENIEGKTNLPDSDGDGVTDYTTTQAFQCSGPQGIAGCGFESHLESMYKALLKADVTSESQYGFVREGAILSVVIISDEVDCSYSEAHRSIFLPESQGGNPSVFWSDPTANAPSSAVCWNAGVACTGGPGTYTECHSSNKDVDGNIDVADAAAVLHPVSRYTNLIQTLEEQKQTFSAEQEVLVALIAGVPPSGEVSYQDSPDPMEQNAFGIGPGCTYNSADGSQATAYPPVRMLEFADAFKVGDDPNVFSICADDFSPALRSIADAIKDQIQPACMTDCVADTDPLTQTLDPSCSLKQTSRVDGNQVETEVPECEPGRTLPEGADVCFVYLIDPAQTPDDTDDEMSETCVEQGWNLEFALVRRPGVPAPGGTSVSALCQLSQQKAVDCPGLP